MRRDLDFCYIKFVESPCPFIFDQHVCDTPYCFGFAIITDEVINAFVITIRKSC